MTLHNSSAQILEEYIDKLFFGIPSQNPDTSITEFVQKYVPIVYKKFNPGDKWIALPPPKEEPKFMTVTNSYFFDKHSNFDAPFKSGQLAITQRIYDEKNYIDQISEYKLLFDFDNEQAAKESYKRLVDTFSSFTVLKRLTSEDGVDKAEFTDKNSYKFYSHIQVILAKDYFQQLSM